MLSGSNEQDMTEHTQTELLLIVHFGFNAGNAFQKMLSLFIIFFKNNSLRKTSGTREDESLSLPDRSLIINGAVQVCKILMTEMI